MASERRRVENLRVVATRRPSDFRSTPGGVSLYSGTCTCCCCCLHWVGALVGGGVGYGWAWKRQFQREPVRGSAHVAFTLGLVLAVGAAVLAATADIDWLVNGWGIPLLVAPFVFFIPAALAVGLSALSSRRVDIPYLTGFVERDESIDTQGAYRAPAAEEQRVVDTERLRRRNGMELSALMRVSFTTVLFSFIGTVVGYVVMLLLYLVFGNS